MIARGFTVIGQALGGFMSRRWHEPQAGTKFRKQIRRRAQKTGRDAVSIEIRDDGGFMVDYYMSANEYQALLSDPVDVDAFEAMVRTWRAETEAKKAGNSW